MEPDEVEALSVALSEGADRLTTRATIEDVDRALEQLVAAAVATVPGADYAGLTLTGSDGTSLVSRASSDPRSAAVDALQVELGEGPCVTAITAGTVQRVVVDDFADEHQRWPRFAPAALEHGVGSLLSFAMAPHDSPPGALNLYSTRRAGFDSTARPIGAGFATQVAIALYGAQRVAGLQRALDRRDVVGQAKGILMERHGLSDDDSFARLVRASQDTNIKLVDVAAWLVAQPHPTVRMST